MARKSKKVKQELEEQRKKLEEVENLLKKVEKEDEELLKSTQIRIDEVCNLNSLFCGVILTKQDLLSIIELALESGENIKIPYKLYFNE